MVYAMYEIMETNLYKPFYGFIYKIIQGMADNYGLHLYINQYDFL